MPLLLDYHGWTMHAAQQDLFYQVERQEQEDQEDWCLLQVADEDPQGFLVVSPEGMGDVGEGGCQASRL